MLSHLNSGSPVEVGNMSIILQMGKLKYQGKLVRSTWQIGTNYPSLIIFLFLS